MTFHAEQFETQSASSANTGSIASEVFDPKGMSLSLSVFRKIGDKKTALGLIDFETISKEALKYGGRNQPLKKRAKIN